MVERRSDRPWCSVVSLPGHLAWHGAEEDIEMRKMVLEPKPGARQIKGSCSSHSFHQHSETYAVRGRKLSGIKTSLIVLILMPCLQELFVYHI